MNHKLLLPFLAVAFTAQAQDTYMNERLINNSGDVIGTARYVGMGGALGALGADISVISWNPAGIGLYRKNDIALTFGGTWGRSYIDSENRGKATFDQIGFVYNIKTGSDDCPYVNFAFNYQKKLNYNHNFYADNANLRELSQMDQVAELADFDRGWQNNLTGMALENGYLQEVKLDDDHSYWQNRDGSSLRNYYTWHSEGALHSFDFNLSTNISNRAFLGLTVGLDKMNFRGWSTYQEDDWEYGRPKYYLNNDYKITGTGVNVKLGAIVRPFEDNAFRIGFTVETPTWYRIRNSTLFDLQRSNSNTGGTIDPWENTDADGYLLRFKLRSPWKVRASMGSTIGSSFAWDVDYEYAAYASMKQGYPNYNNSWSGNTKDQAMNQLTHDNLRGTHTLRVGLEANATKNLAFRLGYNLSTSAYKNNISFDQYSINSAAMDYATSTSYMRMGTTNMLTLGMGYRTKSFYIDLAYKLRNQFADFYAFDTSFTNSKLENLPQFVVDNPGLADVTIDPVEVNLTRHAVVCTLGFKF